MDRFFITHLWYIIIRFCTIYQPRFVSELKKTNNNHNNKTKVKKFKKFKKFASKSTGSRFMAGSNNFGSNKAIMPNITLIMPGSDFGRFKKEKYSVKNYDWINKCFIKIDRIVIKMPSKPNPRRIEFFAISVSGIEFFPSNELNCLFGIQHMTWRLQHRRPCDQSS